VSSYNDVPKSVLPSAFQDRIHALIPDVDLRTDITPSPSFLFSLQGLSIISDPLPNNRHQHFQRRRRSRHHDVPRHPSSPPCRAFIALRRRGRGMGRLAMKFTLSRPLPSPVRCWNVRGRRFAVEDLILRKKSQRAQLSRAAGLGHRVDRFQPLPAAHECAATLCYYARMPAERGKGAGHGLGDEALLLLSDARNISLALPVL
jgi:hypothetical protein